MFYHCQVCGVKLNRNKAYIKKEYDGMEYFLCCPLCQKEFEQNPEEYVHQSKNH